MIKIVLADENCLFRQSLKSIFELNDDVRIVADVDYAEELLPLLSQCSPDVLIADIATEVSQFEMLKKIIEQIPGIKCIALTFNGTFENYNQLIHAGVKGCILKNSDLTELVKAISAVAGGKIYFPQEFLLSMVTHQPINVYKDNNSLTVRELQVLQLLCDGLSNEKISISLHLSYDTVKWHRSNILLKCGCKNILSLYKYALKFKLIQ